VSNPNGRDGRQNAAVARLDEVGPYENDEYPFMNFECPNCGFSICEWTVCPNCRWYDEAIWEATMEKYTECRECGQTIGGGSLCDDCDNVEVVE